MVDDAGGTGQEAAVDHRDDEGVPHLRVAVEHAEAVLVEAFAAVGPPQEEAARIVDALLQAELCEVRTHGLLRVPGYLEGLRHRRFEPSTAISVDRVSPAAALIDGHGALGYLPTWRAVHEAVVLAADAGLAVAGVRNVGEFGRAAYYAEAASDLGYVAMVCQNTPPLIGAPGSSRATHGNNPLAFTAPYPDAPLFDAAFSPRSAGELKRRSLLGLPVPEAWGYVDQSGEPITDPDAAFASVMPAVGGAKGFGLSLLVDLLAGALTGSATGPEVRMGVPEVGAFVLVIHPDLFGAGAGIPAQLEGGATAVRSSGGRWPGDRARAARGANTARGAIDVPVAILAAVNEALQVVGEDLVLRSG